MAIRALASVFVGVVALAGTAPALAEEPDPIYGFMTYGAGDLSGFVVDQSGAPIANAAVHLLLGSAPERIATTDGNGKFKVTITTGGSSWVYVRNARLKAVTLVSSEGNGGVVEIREPIPPAIMPKSLARPFAIPDYSEEAIDRNTWTRAWMLLDVDRTGNVERLKMLASPGMGLDAIAIREAFKLRFEPALDRTRQPMATMVVWLFEWPSYYWLVEHQESTLRRMPAEARRVPCRGSGPTRTTYRDCSRPELGTAVSQSWIDRPAK